MRRLIYDAACLEAAQVHRSALFLISPRCPTVASRIVSSRSLASRLSFDSSFARRSMPPSTVDDHMGTGGYALRRSLSTTPRRFFRVSRRKRFQSR